MQEGRVKWTPINNSSIWFVEASAGRGCRRPVELDGSSATGCAADSTAVLNFAIEIAEGEPVLAEAISRRIDSQEPRFAGISEYVSVVE